MMSYDSKIKNKEIDALFEGILELQNKEECYMYFEDLCTIKEIKVMAQRFKVAKMLKENKKYTQIEEETGASTATISRIARFLNYGSKGYEMILDRLEQKN